MIITLIFGATHLMSATPLALTRRSLPISTTLLPLPTLATASSPSSSSSPFSSAATPKISLTNTFTASRDANISPGGAYETLSNPLLYPPSLSYAPTALDVGAGAGASTEILHSRAAKLSTPWTGAARLGRSSLQRKAFLPRL